MRFSKLGCQGPLKLQASGNEILSCIILKDQTNTRLAIKKMLRLFGEKLEDQIVFGHVFNRLWHHYINPEITTAYGKFPAAIRVLFPEDTHELTLNQVTRKAAVVNTIIERRRSLQLILVMTC